MTVSRLPSVFRKLVVKKLTNNFRDAVSVVETNMSKVFPGPKEVLIKNRFVGINASDVNYTAGKYDPTAKPPFDAGFEGVGEIVGIGDQCSKLKVGQPVIFMHMGSFSEYLKIPEKLVTPIPEAKPEYLPLMVSGLTAAIALDKAGRMQSGETVLVTAAAGGTGQFAVQLAKLAGCHVIGTCSSEEKVQFLQEIGCDRPINYTKESLNEVLKTEYPKGVDVVYESVGGDTYDICVDRLAVKGRLIVIGYISGYQSDTGLALSKQGRTLPIKLITKSASVTGFFLNHYLRQAGPYMQQLVEHVMTGKITSAVDNGRFAPSGPFKGLHSVYDAVDYLYNKKNVGKIVVEFPEQLKSQL